MTSSSNKPQHNSSDPERVLRKKKIEHVRELMCTFEDVYAKQFFDGTGMEYEMRHNKKGTVVAVRIKDKKWAEFRLKTNVDSAACVEQLKQIPQQVEALKALFETMNGDITIIKRPN